MAQLRPRLDKANFEEMTVRMATAEGYRPVAAVDGGGIAVGAAGLRTLGMLYCGAILSIDDLVVGAGVRSSGCGRVLLAWLKVEASRQGRGQLHLEPGPQRTRVHRFYEREGFEKTATHFACTLKAARA